jgi:hypothetical protein
MVEEVAIFTIHCAFCQSPKIIGIFAKVLAMTTGEPVAASL